MKHSVKHYRSIFLSDFHIGAKGFDAAALVRFLRVVRCDHLYLVGDIIDGWKLNKRWYWHEDCTRVLDEFIRMRGEGTKITYLPGNHDEEVRRLNLIARYDFARRLNITIKDKVIHHLANGRRVLVMHGDQFDNTILKGLLSKWSDRLYDMCMDLLQSREAATITIDGKVKKFSLAKALKKHGQRALQLINNFESNVYKQAKTSFVDGLICGHTHIPVVKTIRGVLYANCGSWLYAGHTALVEDEGGVLMLVDCPASHADTPLMEEGLYEVLPRYKKERATSEKLINIIREIWPEQSVKPVPPKAKIVPPAFILPDIAREAPSTSVQ